jgi:hypothetical protein
VRRYNECVPLDSAIRHVWCIVVATMQNATRSEYLARDRVLNLLSDQEVASVATAETADRLADGDEYLDLERLHEGVQKAGSSATPMGRVLPKKAIHENTWGKLLNQLDTAPS